MLWAVTRDSAPEVKMQFVSLLSLRTRSILLFSAMAVCLGCVTDVADDRSADRAIASLDLFPGLEATLFASEPNITNPTNIDVDHRGRVWVCDVVNYRERGSRDERPQGDRILILEDTDGDGVSDSSKVFYQGRDVDAALGLAVLGNKVIVTAAPNVLVFTDVDGDDVPDRKEYLFTQSGAPQNDHSTHSLSFGPDGCLYWNMGNAGRYVHDRHGTLVIDKSGQPVLDRNFEQGLRRTPDTEWPDFVTALAGRSSPYLGGMVFRSEIDGTGTEVLAHNFRNNYEVAVDSLGGLWQSDNDDDGSYACRVNYILEYGNYGYRDEITGARNLESRTGSSDAVPERHWHQNDPGVVPNLLITGAGAPTGVASYEGRLLPRQFWDQVLVTDAGPGVLRGVLAERSGAGYEARSVDILKGERDRWVRPVDVAVAPDGSVFVSDWYDPVVGWNRQQDAAHGRIFRVAPRSHPYEPPEHDFDSVAGAVEALKSPNVSARYLAWQALDRNVEAEPALADLFRSGDRVRHRARALWLLARVEGRGRSYVEEALEDPDDDLRIVGIRAARRLGTDVLPLLRRVAEDSSAHVRRECAIALREHRGSEADALWARLADQHVAGDRWYLEALGIAADGKWDSRLGAWLALVGDRWTAPSGKELVWRSRASRTPGLLAEILSAPGMADAEAPRYVRAFDFQPDGLEKTLNLERLAFDRSGGGTPQSFLVASEALLRLPTLDLGADPDRANTLSELLDRGRGTAQFARLVQRYGIKRHLPSLMEVAALNKDNPVGIASVGTLLDEGEVSTVLEFIRRNPDLAASAVEAVGNTRATAAVPILEEVLLDVNHPPAVRDRAVRSMAAFSQGIEALVDLARRGAFPDDLAVVAGAAVARSMHVRLREEASRLFPVPPLKDREPLPQLTELLVYVGNPERGAEVFQAATCADCHVVHGTGTQFGPDLSEIGGKLAKAGLYESILDPSAGVSPEFELVHLEMADAAEVSGFAVSETDVSVTLRMEGGVVAEFLVSRILDRRKSAVSAMPDDLQEQMSVDDLVDLVEYLSRLR